MKYNFVAKNNYHRGGVHQDQTKVIPRNQKYQEDLAEDFDHETVVVYDSSTNQKTLQQKYGTHCVYCKVNKEGDLNYDVLRCHRFSTLYCELGSDADYMEIIHKMDHFML